MNVNASQRANPADSNSVSCTPLTTRQRYLSLAEFLMGAVIVIGHNVYHKIPNEVPILFVLGLVSFQIRDGSWRALGLRWPHSWKKTVLLALAAAALRILWGFLWESVSAHFWPPIKGPSGANEIAGHWLVALEWLGLIWTFAAFGEEISYRGYLLNRTAEIGNRSKSAYGIAVLLVSILFGYGHFYKGPTGIVDSGVAGLILGTVYLFSGRNLWASILTHGFIDTIGVIAAFLGWDR
jgi:uncharacterized protein